VTGTATASRLEPDRIVGEVAGAVGLAEGEAGVRDVIRTVARHEPVAVRGISRTTELPVPFVAAICNELRKRGVVSVHRPVQLTSRGRRLFAAAALRLPVDAVCPTCAGREIVVPRRLSPAAEQLAKLAEGAPSARLELDQTHCTVETKLRRVLTMYEAGALDGRTVMLLGDDDLTSLAIKLVVEQLGLGATLAGLIVVDVDSAVLDYLRKQLRGAPFPVDCVHQDLRVPLPSALRGVAQTVFTDPPYTERGAELFLSRTAQATAPGRADVFLSFGARRPQDTLAVQRAISSMGFVVRTLVRNFNEYLGAGALGGTSHLYHLRTTSELRPLVDGTYDGPLYTGEFREPARPYRCTVCRQSTRVGPSERWQTIAALRQDGCPHCGGAVFIPRARTKREHRHHK
jgi:predicted methyltransferase/DNA-directed RNA polymerase subunit RPC12/RpoP